MTRIVIPAEGWAEALGEALIHADDDMIIVVDSAAKRDLALIATRRLGKKIQVEWRCREEGKMQKDPFEAAPEFLAAFNNIAAKGFFEHLTVEIGGVMAEGRPFFCSIRGSGCIPNDEKYAAAGCGALVNPDNIVANAHLVSARYPIKEVVVEVKTADWPLCDKRGEKVIGSKGTRTTFSMFIMFES